MKDMTEERCWLSLRVIHIIEINWINLKIKNVVRNYDKYLWCLVIL